MSRFGFSTVTLSGALPEKLEAIASAGFAATEITSGDMFETSRGVDYGASVVREAGLDVSAYQVILGFEGCRRAELRRKLELAKHMSYHAQLMGTDLVVLASNATNNCTGERGVILADLNDLADQAARQGCRIGFEALCWGTHISDYRDAWSLVREVDYPSLGMVLDSAHIFPLDLPYAPIETIPGDKIFLVEIADLPRLRLPLREASLSYRLFPGEGTVDLEGLVRAAEVAGYKGTYSLEIHNAQYARDDAAAVAARGYRAIAELWASVWRM